MQSSPSKGHGSEDADSMGDGSRFARDGDSFVGDTQPLWLLRRACRCDEERSLSALAGPLESPAELSRYPLDRCYLAPTHALDGCPPLLSARQEWPRHPEDFKPSSGGSNRAGLAVVDQKAPPHGCLFRAFLRNPPHAPSWRVFSSWANPPCKREHSQTTMALRSLRLREGVLSLKGLLGVFLWTGWTGPSAAVDPSVESTPSMLKLRRSSCCARLAGDCVQGC